jgi:hypothetical protein
MTPIFVRGPGHPMLLSDTHRLNGPGMEGEELVLISYRLRTWTRIVFLAVEWDRD